MSRLNIYLSEEEKEQLKKIAKKNKTSMNSLIKQKVFLNYYDGVESIAEVILRKLRTEK